MAYTRDSFLIKRICQKWQCMIPETCFVRGITASSLVSLWSLTLNWRKPAAVLGTFKQRPTWQGIWASSQLLCEWTILESPVQLQLSLQVPAALGQHFDITSWEALNQNHLPKPLPYSTQKLCEIIHAYCFKPLHFEIICYAAIASYYKSLESSSVHCYSWKKNIKTYILLIIRH